MEEVAFHRIQKLDQFRQVASILKLKDTDTKLDLPKVKLGYLSSILAGKIEFYEPDLQNSKWTEELFFRKWHF